MPGGANAEVFAQGRDLARRTQTADLRDMDADEINQPVFDQGQIFMLCVEQFAHRDRRVALLAEQREMSVLFRRERVFNEERAVFFDVLADLNSLLQRDSLVDV